VDKAHLRRTHQFLLSLMVGMLRFAHPTRNSGGNPMPAAFFVVRATVTDPAKREAFGVWYSREHLPDAMKSFGAVKAWRYWSATDPSLHHAMYQFTDKAALDRATEGPEMKRLVADFNRDWPDVTRTREVLVLAEELAA
jgi:hypothetical protein